MKNQFSIKVVLLIVAIILLPLNVQSQISSADSISFTSAGNDTTKLRQIVTSRRGERIAGRARHKIALLAYNNKREDFAEKEFLATRSEYPGIPEAIDAAYYLGVISLHKEKPGTAKNYLTEYMSLDSGGINMEWANYYFQKVLYRNKDIEYENAVRSYLRSNRSLTTSKEPIVRSEFIRYLMDHGKLDEAITEVSTMIQLFPNDARSVDAQFKAGDILILQGKHAEAETYYKTILKNRPKNSEISARAQFQLAGVYDSKGDFVSARREYFSAKQNYAQFSRWKKASEHALAMLTFKEWQRNPDSASYVNTKKQISDFIKNNPTDRHVPRALMAVADLATHSGDYDDAIIAYDRILSFDEDLIPLKPNASIRSNDVIAFKQMLHKVHLSKGAVLQMRMHKPDRALTEYNEVLKDNPNVGEALLHKALCLIELERSDEAKVILRQLVKNNDEEKTTADQILSTLVD